MIVDNGIKELSFSVSHDLDNKREWEQCLQVNDVILPTGYFFGASATTGDLSDAHDIISTKLFELEAPEGASNEDRSKLAPKSSFFEPPRGKKQNIALIDPSSS